MIWRTARASVTGGSHRQTGTECQDYAALEQYPDGLLLGALSDGAGSAAHSAVGSRVAVRTALEVLRTADWSRPPDEVDLWDIFHDIVDDIGEQTRRQALRIQDREGLTGLAPADFYATLLAFASGPGFLATLQIGDGFIVYRRHGREDYELSAAPDKGEFFNQTSFVHGGDVNRDGRVMVLTEAPEFILASSDGLETVALNLNAMRPFGPFFQWFEGLLAERENYLRASEHIRDFLLSGRLERKSDDDKTVLACLATKPGSWGNRG